MREMERKREGVKEMTERQGVDTVKRMGSDVN